MRRYERSLYDLFEDVRFKMFARDLNLDRGRSVLLTDLGHVTLQLIDHVINDPSFSTIKRNLSHTFIACWIDRRGVFSRPHTFLPNSDYILSMPFNVQYDPSYYCRLTLAINTQIIIKEQLFVFFIHF